MRCGAVRCGAVRCDVWRSCVPAMGAIVARLKAEFAGEFDVVEVFGTEPYADQVWLWAARFGLG